MNEAVKNTFKVLGALATLAVSVTALCVSCSTSERQQNSSEEVEAGKVTWWPNRTPDHPSSISVQNFSKSTSYDARIIFNTPGGRGKPDQYLYVGRINPCHLITIKVKNRNGSLVMQSANGAGLSYKFNGSSWLSSGSSTTKLPSVSSLSGLKNLHDLEKGRTYQRIPC